MKEQPKIILCPHCGEEENFHFNYDYTQKHMPIINVLCNECGEFFNSKEQQKKLITEIMEEDAKDGLYKFDYSKTTLNNMKKDFGSEFPQYINEKPFNVTFSHKGDSVIVHLLNGEDVLKLADVFSQFLTENGIDNWVERKDKNK
jgi:hypothetical protein